MPVPTQDRLFIDAHATLPAYSNITVTRAGFDSQSQSRLQHLKAVLQAAGIKDLSSLGKLSLNGHLLPRTGITHPKMPAILGESHPFQSAYVAHPQAAHSLVRAGGTGRVLHTLPLAPAPPPSPRSTLAAITMPINVAYWAASWVDLEDNTVVVLQQPVMALVIIAEKITIGNNVSFTWERPVQANLSAKPAKPPKPGRAPTATSIDKPPAGTHGNPGLPGDPQGVHFRGLDAPDLEIWSLDFNGHPVIDLRGQDGFDGAPGGDGGDGGDGAPGKPDETDFLGFCKSGPGNGGDGGAGGAAGNGGAGGDGGTGGKFALYAPQTVLNSFEVSMSINIDGGAPGAGGIPGVPGAGGAGGPRGDNSHGCKPASPRSAGSAGAQGTGGNRGPNGRHGGQRDQAVSLQPIDAEAFKAELSKPGIAILNPNPARCCQAIQVSGNGFSRTDKIVVAGTTCAATVQSDTAMQFNLPNVRGGVQFVQVVRADGTLSNQASIYIEPTIDTAMANTRHVPGATVRLRGSGFAPGMQVQVNRQDMPGVAFVDATTVDFKLVRPSSVTANPMGETVAVQVVLADAGPNSASNSMNLVLDTFRMLVFGDSVVWGQGLEETNKFHSIVEQAVRQKHGDIGVYKDVRAHSGATILPPKGETVFTNRVNGEIPTSFPTISTQVQEFESLPDAQRDDVDLILMDGGINDINVINILSPTTSDSAIKSDVKKFCHDAMLTLLNELTGKFKMAKIIVTGYFQIVSNQSNLALLDAFMIGIGLDLGGIPGAVVGGVVTAATLAKIEANAALFASEANRQLKVAVDDANAALGPGKAPRVFFADPRFTPANSALAPDAFLYGIHADLSPEDPASVSGPRATACDLAGSVRTNVQICHRASIGHPNAKGARAYANAVLPLL